MQAQYPDIQGWLTIPGTNIDYPVLQSGESAPEYYLKRNYRGEWDANGSLFLQWNCDVSVFPFQQTEFSGETGLLEYVRQAKSLGLFGTGALCLNPERALTLVTCSYEWDSARNVVISVRKTDVPVD